ncbi:MAG: hypothetical protein JO157_08885 [Acetobacteraceae bacterium]|nr:hypothetical protein [Acetobacteraceae bacterium]
MTSASLRARGRTHLQEARLDYLAHLRRATGFGAALMGAGLACFVHGLIPGLFTNTASRTILRLHKDMTSPEHRTPQQDWIEFEI